MIFYSIGISSGFRNSSYCNQTIQLLFNCEFVGSCLYIFLHLSKIYHLINDRIENEGAFYIYKFIYTFSAIYSLDFILIWINIKIVMQEGAKFQKSFQVVTKIKKEIDEMVKSPDQATLLDILQRITELVKQDHLGVIIALYKDEQLLKFIKTVTLAHSQKRKQSIEKHIAILYLCAYDCFFKYKPLFAPSFTYFTGKMSPLLINGKTFKEHTQNYPSYQILRGMLNKYFEISEDKKLQNYQKGELLNKYVKQILNVNQPKTLLQECVFTFIRKQLQSIQGTILKAVNKQQIGFCCNLHFEHKGVKNHVQTQSQNFTNQFQIKNFNPKQSLTKQIQTIKKQIISYLNSASGIYYLGIEYNIKQARFIGIALDQQKKKQLVTILFTQLVMKIFPADGENEDEDEKIEEARLSKLEVDKKASIVQSKAGFNYQYILNSFISVDFINLYDKDTWLYARMDELPLYIVRIKVRIGSEYEVYHHINSKQIPQAFLREDKKEKKLTMIQYYDEVYRRLKNKANNKTLPAPKYHALCRVFENNKQMI